MGRVQVEHISLFRVFRVFDMLTVINSGTIFAYLGMSAPFVGISLYNLEHVSVSTSFLLHF